MFLSVVAKKRVFYTGIVLLIVFGFLFVPSGIASLVEGQKSYLQAPLDESYGTIKFSICTAIGVVSLILAAVGFGIVQIKANRVIWIYLTLLFILFVSVLIFEVIIYTKEGNPETENKIKRFNDELFNGEKYNREIIDELQEGAKCCGYEGPEYYGENVPFSCCITVSQRDGRRGFTKVTLPCGQDPQLRWNRGCKDAYYPRFLQVRNVLGVFVILLEIAILISLISLIFFIQSHQEQEFQATFSY